MLLSKVLDAPDVARTLCVARRYVYALHDPYRILSESCSRTPDGYRVWFRLGVESWARMHPSQEERGPRPRLPAFGTSSGQVDTLLASATEIAAGLNHPRVDEDHMVLALADPTCPGAARAVLESLGVSPDGLRAQMQQRHGDPFDHFDGEPDSTGLAPALGRAGSAAADLHDDAVCSEHLLLAIAERSPLLMSREITTPLLRGRTLAVTDGAADIVALPPVTEPHIAWTPLEDHRAAGLHLAASPLGHHPLDRKPWEDALLCGPDGQNLSGDGARCLVDRDGHPVRTTDGLLIQPATDGRYQPFAPQDGWQALTWPELHARAIALASTETGG